MSQSIFFSISFSVPELSVGFICVFWSGWCFDVAAGTWILYRSVMKVKGYTCCSSNCHGLVDVITLTGRTRKVWGGGKGWESLWQASCPQIHPWLVKTEEAPYFVSGCITGRPASGLQVRWWCCTVDTTSLLPKEKKKWTYFINTRWSFYFIFMFLWIITNLMFYQRSKPTFLTVNMPALDGGERDCVHVLQRENTGDEIPYMQYIKLPLDVHVKLQ